ncbi:MAG: TraR/DksA family transcriptional regulator [Syntrophobacteraceae bacterium]
MSREEIMFLRNMLLDRRSSVLDRVRKLAAAWQELEERAIELEEEAQKASIQKPYDQLDVSGKLEIEQIDLALTKMTIGEYGVCESCGDDISPRRLEVLPSARLCVECARDYEKTHRRLPRTTEAVGAARIPDEYQGLTNDQIVHAIYERLQSDERIDTEELKIAVRKGVLYLDGAVPGELEHEIIHQLLTDVMGFTAIVDHLEVNELILERDDYEDRSAGRAGLGDRLFYDHDDMHEDTFESMPERSRPRTLETG